MIAFKALKYIITHDIIHCLFLGFDIIFLIERIHLYFLAQVLAAFPLPNIHKQSDLVGYQVDPTV